MHRTAKPFRSALVTSVILSATIGVHAVAGGDSGEGECIIRKVTPNWVPGTEGEWGDTLGVLAISQDGKLVAYSSYTTLHLPDAGQMQGHIQQIIVRDRDTQEGELISVAFDPKPGQTISGNNHASWYLGMSPNGRYVAWGSQATNHVGPEFEVNGQHIQAFVRDRWEQKTYIASVNSNGEVANNWSSLYRVGVSDNGRVVFSSRATNLVEDQPVEMWQVYVHDVNTGETILASRDFFGNPSPQDASHPSISADGTVVSFMSRAPLTPDVTWDTWNIFVRDFKTDTTELVSVDADGNDRAGHGDFSHLSADGNRVAFRFDSFNGPLDPTFPPFYLSSINVKDRTTGAVTAVNVSWDGQPATMSPEIGFTLSANGEFVAWDSIDQVVEQPKLMPTWHVFRTHIDTRETVLVDMDRFCQPIQEQQDIMWSAISGDGMHVVWNSMWHVMYDDDFDWSRHLYVWSDLDGVEPGIPGDLNGDGVVDGADLGILLNSWGPCRDGNPCLGDLNGDGAIDGADLGILLNNWS